MVTFKRLRPFIPLIFSLLLALVLFFLVEDFLRNVIIGPLLYVIWFLTLIVESLPQGVIWAVLLLFMLIIAIASLQKEKSGKFTIGQLSSQNSGQVEKWARLLDRAQRDRFTRWRLANKFKRLTRKLSSPDNDKEKNHYQDDPTLPAEIAAFFEAVQPTKTTFWDRFNTINQKSDETETELDLDPEIVIQYLEKRLKP